MTIRVLIADDQDLVRTGFELILTSADDIEVVGYAANGREAIEQVDRLQPDVVLMDVQMPQLDGIEATRQVAHKTKVVILTTFDSDNYLFDSLDAGAVGFLLKNCGPEMLIEAVRRAHLGHALLSPEVTIRVIRHTTSPTSPEATIDGLTSREVEVLKQIALGKSNIEIAKELHLGESTIKTHVSHILTKLDLRDRVQAVVFAYRSGLMS